MTLIYIWPRCFWIGTLSLMTAIRMNRVARFPRIGWTAVNTMQTITTMLMAAVWVSWTARCSVVCWVAKYTMLRVHATVLVTSMRMPRTACFPKICWTTKLTYSCHLFLLKITALKIVTIDCPPQPLRNSYKPSAIIPANRSTYPNKAIFSGLPDE